MLFDRVVFGGDGFMGSSDSFGLDKLNVLPASFAI